MDVAGFLDEVRTHPGYADQIVYVHRETAREARFTRGAPGLSPRAWEFLARLGIERLFGHQGEAIEALLAGRDVVVTTGSASGKSVCYQVPILEAILTDSASTALLVFPTKALARDLHRPPGIPHQSPGPRSGGGLAAGTRRQGRAA